MGRSRTAAANMVYKVFREGRADIFASTHHFLNRFHQFVRSPNLVMYPEAPACKTRTAYAPQGACLASGQEEWAALALLL